ncbi:hypothetical protein N7463_009259 [Penicillium fimorum]|uniref:Uncharacterized protein n=1 Tax=Penicillium fimorum TaxID=1882269 RepID=A0A9X0C423_9EURO|nr:hypothetical protein N7463_009259 [Penicillium fimorum]
MTMAEYPPYTPMPSLNHELGLMFGFLSLFVVAMGAYIALWRIFQTRLHAQHLARRKVYRDKTSTQVPLGATTSVTAGPTPSPNKDVKPNAAVQEKILDRIGMPENRAELPVHGMKMYTAGKWNTSPQHVKCPFSRATPLGPVSPASPLGSGGSGRAVGFLSPVGGGIAFESIVGVALDGGRSWSQGLRVDEFRLASPARRFGGDSGRAVEIWLAPSRE